MQTSNIPLKRPWLHSNSLISTTTIITTTSTSFDTSTCIDLAAFFSPVGSSFSEQASHLQNTHRVWILGNRWQFLNGGSSPMWSRSDLQRWYLDHMLVNSWRMCFHQLYFNYNLLLVTRGVLGYSWSGNRRRLFVILKRSFFFLLSYSFWISFIGFMSSIAIAWNYTFVVHTFMFSWAWMSL